MSAGPRSRPAPNALAALNPGVRIDAHHTRLTAANADGLIAGYDIVADGSDNFATRFLLNDACYFAEENPGLGGGDGIRRPARHLQGLGHKRRLSLLSLPVSRAAAARHGAQLFGDRRAGRGRRRDGIAAGAGSAEGNRAAWAKIWPENS